MGLPFPQPLLIEWSLYTGLCATETPGAELPSSLYGIASTLRPGITVSRFRGWGVASRATRVSDFACVKKQVVKQIAPNLLPKKLTSLSTQHGEVQA